MTVNWFANWNQYVAGAATGSFFTLLGTWIQGRAAKARQKEQLDWEGSQRQKQRNHDAEEAERERLQSLRKDIYIPFVRTMADALNFVENANNLTDDEYSLAAPLTALKREAAIVVLLSPKEVIEPLERFRHLLTRTMTTMMEQHGDLCLIRYRVGLIEKNIAKLDDDFNALISTADPEDSDSLSTLKYLDTQSRRLGEEKLSANSKVHELNSRLTIELSVFNEPARKAMRECLFSIRSQINLPLDLQWYADYTEQTVSEIALAAEERYEQTKTTAAEMMHFWHDYTEQKLQKNIALASPSRRTARKRVPKPPTQPAAPQSGSDDTPSSETAPPEDSAEGSSGSQSR